MSTDKLYFLIICLILFVNPVSAENYYFKRYGKENGLSHQTVFCALQDSRGFMWFGTKSGLNRFDGTNFKVYMYNNDVPYSLINNTVHALAEGTDGLFWIGTSDGLCVYDPQKDMFSPFHGVNCSIEEAIDHLTFDKQGNLWCTNYKGIYCVDTNSGKCIFFPVLDYFVPTGLKVTQSGSVWFLGMDGNIYLYNHQNKSFISYPVLTANEKAQHIHLYSILECSNGDLLVTTDRIGAKRFSPNSGLVETLFKEDANGNPIYIHTAIMRDKDEFWFGTESGIHIYKLGIGFVDNLQKSYNDAYSLSDNAIHMLYKDREEGVWAGTFFGGINYLANNNTLFEKYLPKDSDGNIRANVIREIHVDPEGNLWVGTEDGGLCYFNTQTKQFKALTNLSWNGHFISKNIQCLMVDNNTVWVGTFDRGIYVVDLRTKGIVEHYNSEDLSSGLFVNGIVCLKRTSGGDILVGTMGGLYRFDKLKKKFQLIHDLEWGLIHSIYEDSENTIWVVTLGRGMFTLRLNDSTNDITVNPIPVLGNFVTTILEDSKKRLWIGTEGNGIYLYDRHAQAVTQELLKLESSAQIVYQIVEDGTNKLWITTSNGLLCYDPDQKKVNRFTTLNGLPIDQFNYNSGYQDKIGNIYFGSLKGLIVFSPENFKKTSEPMKVYFTGFQLLNNEIETSQPNSPLKKSIIFSDEIVLKHDQSTFNIDFAIPTYAISQNVWYRYKLEGVDKDWNIKQGSAKLYYTKLPPGKYVLYVQASTDSSVWTGAPSSLTIIVSPPFWSMPIAYFLYLLIFIAVFLYLFIHYRKKMREREANRMEKLQSDKQKEILQAKISFFTNITHEIRTPLTLIMGSLNRIIKNGGKKLVENESIMVMHKNTQRLLDLVNQLLDFRKIESSTFLMSFVKTDVRQVLEETFSRFTPMTETKGIRYTIIMPDDECFVVADKEALIKIISNMLNNAIKFSDEFVEVILECQEDSIPVVRIRVNNDGELIPQNISSEIFKPFYQYFGEETKAPIKGSGLGLPLAKSLAEMHNGSFYLDNSVTNLNSFVLELPLDQHQVVDTLSPQKYNKGKEVITAESIHDYSNINNYNILIVDDEIELRQFVCEELAPQYNVFVADNGKQALEILENHIISLIVSDLMMPIMDGIELCKTVKSNIKYCHIPILVLTAKTSLQAHIDALDSKADAYIEKPFSTEHLLAQISNLLANRELIRSTFVRSPHAHLISVASNSIDERFINKMNEYVMNNLSDSRLSVETLAEYMNMSVSTLYRKVKAITSLPPNDFIRLCRLKKSAEMLASGEYRISEVAECLGFSTTSYFTSCFMKQFGVTPSNFLKNDNDKSVTTPN